MPDLSLPAPYDHFMVIDWSARNRPSPARPARNAIWLAEGRAGATRTTTKYFRTRAACVAYVRRRLLRLSAAGKRVMVGWDFSFGYPKGLARALRLPDKPRWKAVWAHLHGLIQDDERNANNRFAVGGRLNQDLQAPGGPFWGAPPGSCGIFLGAKKDFPYPVPTPRALLAERRVVERLHPRMQPAWKLAYTGSVGSQALLGIPRLYTLRFLDETLGPVSRVWPFETDDEHTLVVHAEIYPSLVTTGRSDRIVDRGQVRDYLTWLRKQQAQGTLTSYLQAPWGEDPALGRRVRKHEGWVLGVKDRSQ